MLYSYLDKRPQVDPSAWLAPGARVAGEVEIAADCGIWYNVVARGDMAPVKIGRGTNVQDNATLHTAEGQPCIIGENVTIGHNAVVHGCTVGDDVLIGMNATILNGAKIGDGAVVAAGALVTEHSEIPGGMLVAGVPAKILRPVRAAEASEIKKNVAIYMRLALEYRELSCLSSEI